tara:strand:- start:3005 stop:3508 length:504 start_codon:yes stop_codon:yes gene_type:complete
MSQIGLLNKEQLKQLQNKIELLENKIKEENEKKRKIISEKDELYAMYTGSQLSENKKEEIIKQIGKLFNDETNQIRREEELINQIKPLIMKIMNHDQAIHNRVNSLKLDNKIATLRTQLGITKTKGGKSKKHKKTNHKKTIHKKHKKTNHKKTNHKKSNHKKSKKLK